MKRSDIKNIYRLSPMQMNIYHSYIQDPSSEIYHQQVSNTISYSFDIKHLERAFEKLVQRHDILRTVFNTVKDTVVQVVLQQRKPSYFFVDLSDELDKSVLSESYIQRDKNTHFDLNKDNLIRL